MRRPASCGSAGPRFGSNRCIERVESEIIAGKKRESQAVHPLLLLTIRGNRLMNELFGSKRCTHVLMTRVFAIKLKDTDVI